MLAVIRIKGEVGLPREKKRALALLSLFKANHMVIAGETETTKKMIKTVEEIVTFGELNEDAFALVLEKRGRISGNKRITAEFLKKHKHKSFSELAKAVLVGKAKLEELGIKKVFRLRPPSKGFERAGIKRAFAVGGVVGYRAQAINDLIKRMA